MFICKWKIGILGILELKKSKRCALLLQRARSLRSLPVSSCEWADCLIMTSWRGEAEQSQQTLPVMRGNEVWSFSLSTPRTAQKWSWQSHSQEGTQGGPPHVGETLGWTNGNRCQPAASSFFPIWISGSFICSAPNCKHWLEFRRLIITHTYVSVCAHEHVCASVHLYSCLKEPCVYKDFIFTNTFTKLEWVQNST